jgi:hypothetical protein
MTLTEINARLSDRDLAQPDHRLASRDVFSHGTESNQTDPWPFIPIKLHHNSRSRRQAEGEVSHP